MKNLLLKVKKNKYLILTLIAAAGLRLVAINQSFWLDEAIGALVVKNLGFKEILTQFSGGDFHPPLYYLTLKIWSALFGYSEPALRGLSVVVGIATVYLTYLIARKLSNNRFTVLISTLLVATSQLHIYYSQEARMYAMAAFFAALAVYSYLNILKKDSLSYWTVFSLSLTALIFTDYLPVFLLPIFWIYGFFRGMRASWWKKLLLAHFPLVVGGLLFLPIFLSQLKVGGELTRTLPAWSGVVGGSNLKQLALVWMKFTLGRISLENKIYYYSLILAGSIPFVAALVRAWKERGRILLVILWLGIPLALSFLFSLLYPAFSYFRLVFLVPAFYLTIATGATKIADRRIRNMVCVLLIVLNLVSWLLYVSDPHQQRERWREAVAFVESRIKKDEVVLLEYPWVLASYEWYAKDLSFVRGATDSLSADVQKTSEKTSKLLTGVNGVYYFEYLRDLTDPQRVVEAALESASYKKDAIFDFFPGVGQITYYTKAN